MVIMMNKPIFLGLYFIVIFQAFNCGRSEYPVKIGKRENIQTVFNPSYPKNRSSSIELIELLSIGEKDGTIESTFNTIKDINIDPSGNIYVVDYSDNVVKIYDSSGVFVSIIGRKGQGPGEFFEPARVFFESQNRIVVHEYGNGSRISRFSNNNDFIDSFQIGFSRALIGIDENDVYYYSVRENWNYSTGEETRSFSRYNADNSKINQITQLKGQNGTPMTRGGLWTTGYESGSVNYALRQNGELIIGKSDMYEFSVFDKNGNLKLLFGRKWRPVEVTESEKMKLSVNPFDQKLIPDKKPAFRISYFRFLTDDKNNFWVLTFEDEGEGYTYDIFNRDGIYIRKVFFEWNGSKVIPFYIRRNKVYALHIDEFGVNRVKVYRYKFL